MTALTSTERVKIAAAKRQARGEVEFRLWLTPDVAEKLDGLARLHGNKRKAIEALILAAAANTQKAPPAGAGGA